MMNETSSLSSDYMRMKPGAVFTKHSKDTFSKLGETPENRGPVSPDLRTLRFLA